MHADIFVVPAALMAAGLAVDASPVGEILGNAPTVSALGGVAYVVWAFIQRQTRSEAVFVARQEAQAKEHAEMLKIVVEGHKSGSQGNAERLDSLTEKLGEVGENVARLVERSSPHGT